jgi:hypothetical protein
VLAGDARRGINSVCVLQQKNLFVLPSQGRWCCRQLSCWRHGDSDMLSPLLLQYLWLALQPWFLGSRGSSGGWIVLLRCTAVSGCRIGDIHCGSQAGRCRTLLSPGSRKGQHTVVFCCGSTVVLVLEVPSALLVIMNHPGIRYVRVVAAVAARAIWLYLWEYCGDRRCVG